MIRAALRGAFGALSGSAAARRLMIFTYHRVLAEQDYLLSGEPTAARFDDHARFIATYLHPLPLAEAVQRLYAGTLPRRAACITFDDGYRNNYEVAAPILEKHGLPATFFVTTGAIEQGAMWNDRVIEAVRHAPVRWDLSGMGLETYECDGPAARVRTLGAILEPIKYRAHDEREALSRQLLEMTGRSAELTLMMTPDMIRDLAARGFEIGGHTVTHPILLQMDDEEVLREIIDGRSWLADVAGQPPVTFAYPNGQPGVDFLPRHGDLVKRAGFECAVSTEWATATPASNRFALPRFTPWEYGESGWVTRIGKSYLASYLGS